MDTNIFSNKMSNKLQTLIVLLLLELLANLLVCKHGNRALMAFPTKYQPKRYTGLILAMLITESVS